MTALAYKLGAGGIALIIAFTVGWVVHGWKDDSQYKASYVALVKQVNAEQAKSKVLEDRYQTVLSQYNQNNKKAESHVEIEIEKYPVYSKCVVPVNGVQLINAAINKANSLKPT